MLVNHVRFPELFNFPKGKINESEDPLDCAIREAGAAHD